MKKLLKIVGIVLGIVILLLALSPFFFEGTKTKKTSKQRVLRLILKTTKSITLE